MSFVLQNISLIKYANGITMKLVLYTKSKCATISEEKIEKRGADIKK